ncbi:AraC family transcriptional regulator [Jiulongibacter sediminis]|uniref:AraC family transcriptional regulator n=1 Tax=Jiulongibacter sediminis TaxID=1605367 RepID=UPI0026F00F11|nr:AraC family transcriptional regulator [Jiulongibacter sediminis]
MKPIFQKLPHTRGSSFIFERYVSPRFETPWHYHEELEIVLCDGGFGKKVVGNHTSEYQEGDLLLLGGNLPHLFQADDYFYRDNHEQKPAAIVLQFRMESFGQLFFDMVEMEKVRMLFQRAHLGIEFFGEVKVRIRDILKENIHESGMKRLTSLLTVLSLMSETSEYQTLSEIGMLGVSVKDSERMHTVFDLIFKNFRDQITVEQAASLTNLSKPAFCRYFKARTQKTFVDYLTNVRLEHSCKLLRETDLSILEICFESGFNNLSNFNRQFRKRIGCQPNVFRKGFRWKEIQSES